MAVDRGELRYIISVDDQFSKPLKAFQEGLAAIKGSLEELKLGVSVVGALTSAVDEMTRSSGRRTTAVKEQITAEDRLEKLIRQAGDEEELRIAASARLLDVANLRKKSINDLQAAEQKLADIVVKQRVAELTNNLAKEQGITLSKKKTDIQKLEEQQARETEKATRAAAAEQIALGTALGNLAVNALTGIGRAIVDGFTSAVATTIHLNREIENSTLAVASLVLETGSVADATGKAATGARALALAQGEARRQTLLLRDDALSTTASFTALAETFRVAIAPGVEAGLSLDQLRKFTVQFAQAGQALGVQENLFALEIRQILSGTIQNRTRVASALGITNQDIEAAKQTGQLAEFLTERFKGFGAAAQEIGNTFDGAFSRIQNVLGQIIQQGGLEFFEAMKGVLQDIFAQLTAIDINGKLKPNPEILLTVKQIGTGIADITTAAKPLVKLFAGEVPDALNVTKIGIDALITGVLNFRSFFTGDFDKLKRDSDAFFARTDAGTAALSSPKPVENIIRLSEVFASIPPNIERARVLLEKQSEVFKKLDDDAAKAREALVSGTADFGLSGAVLAERKAAFAQQFDIAQKTKQLTAEQKSAELELVDIEAARIDNAARIAAFSNTNKIENVIADQKLVLDTENEIADAKARGDNGALAALTERLLKTKALVDRDSAGFTDRDKALAEESLRLEGQAVVKADEIRKIQEARLAVEEKINAAAQSRLTLIAEVEAKRLREQNSLLAVQVVNQKAVTDAKIAQLGGAGTASAVQAAQAQAVLEEAQTKQFIDRGKALNEQEALEKSIAESRERELKAAGALAASGGDPAAAASASLALADATRQRSSLEEQLGETVKNNTLRYVEQTEKIRVLEAELQHIRDIQSNPLGTAALDKLTEFADVSKNIYSNAIKDIESIVDNFATTATNSIFDSLDPTKKSADIRKAWSDLFLSISKTIVGSLINTTAKAAVSAASEAVQVGLGIAKDAAFAFFNEGGQVPASAPASLAHYARPQGFRRGGPPKGVHPSDTVPIWTQPGEWIMRLAAVRKYGAATMNAINEGLIDPTSLAGLAGSRASTGSVRMPVVPSFAAGGLISDQIAVSRRPSADASSPGVTLAAVVPDERSYERLIRGGRAAHLRFLHDNQHAIRGVMGNGER